MRNYMARFVAFVLLSLIASASAPMPASAVLGDCSQPFTSGVEPVATDCLFILHASIDLVTCTPECICDPAGGGTVLASDALACLQVATGIQETAVCDCSGTTTTTIDGLTTTTTIGGSTTTTIGGSTTTTIGGSTTTTIGGSTTTTIGGSTTTTIGGSTTTTLPGGTTTTTVGGGSTTSTTSTTL